jgi:exodeoxyribonuclease V beta subunit
MFIGSGMENKFDVLSPDFNCFTSHFLEASAGTGKTFAIEHTVAKLLSSNPPLDLKDILVVTFTRSATADLKSRIFENLKKLSKEEQDFQRACHLKKALARFEEANIYTIHGFCLQCLKDFAPLAGIALDLTIEEGQSKEKKLVKDYLLYRMHLDDFSPKQIQRLLSFYQSDEERLLDACTTWMSKGRNVILQPTFTELYSLFIERKKVLLNVDTLLDEFIANKKYFEKINNIKREVKKEVIEQFDSFALFLANPSPTIEEFDHWIAMGDPISNYLKGNPPENCSVISAIFKEISPIIKLARNPHHLLARVVSGSIKLKNSIDEASFWSMDDLLRLMHKSLDNPQFLKKIKEKYKVAIIDEFQDTDPIQWDIFKRCFVEDPNIICYLVGDPKQSIYAFRRADIYTYLDAKEALKKGIKASLTTNFRSTIPLVNALNTLFCTTSWMPLPKYESNLQVEEVDAKKEGHPFIDDKGALHFFISSFSKPKDAEELFFSFIANEIIGLKGQKFSFKDIAILIKDRYQESRLVSYLKDRGIDSICKKGITLVESKGFLSLKRLFDALSDIEDLGKQTLCLIDPFFGYCLKDLSDKDIKSLMPQFKENETLVLFLDRLIFERAKTLLTRKEGLNLLRQVRQTLELILENVDSKSRVKEVQAFLEDALVTYKNKVVVTEEADAVSIMTMHMSKGLEFDIVFALGATFRSSSKEELIDDGQYLIPSCESLPQYKTFVKERDAEKARQLYVALTRAKKRVYVPLNILKDTQTADEGTLSPIELFFNSHGVFQETILDKISFWSKEAAITYEVVQKSDSNPYYDQAQENISLKKPLKALIDKRHEKISSYSSLATHHSKPAFEGIKEFPSSAQTGVLLHEIFEKEAFTSEALKNVLFGTELSSYFHQIQEVINLALDIPLKSAYTTFSLKNVAKNRQIKEIEFLIDSEEAKGFVTGFIDLVIEHENRYYIIDWKSNLLNGYSQEDLEQEMQNQSYLLQESLYREALKKYLQNSDERAFEDCFGGSFYIFLRGLKQGGGIWYKP